MHYIYIYHHFERQSRFLLQVLQESDHELRRMANSILAFWHAVERISWSAGYPPDGEDVCQLVMISGQSCVALLIVRNTSGLEFSSSARCLTI